MQQLLTMLAVTAEPNNMNVYFDPNISALLKSIASPEELQKLSKSTDIRSQIL
jgi:hypothetical protein